MRQAASGCKEWQPGARVARCLPQVDDLPLPSLLPAVTWRPESYFKPRKQVPTRFRESRSEWCFHSFSHWRMPHVALILPRVDGPKQYTLYEFSSDICVLLDLPLWTAQRCDTFASRSDAAHYNCDSSMTRHQPKCRTSVDGQFVRRHIAM